MEHGCDVGIHPLNPVRDPERSENSVTSFTFVVLINTDI